MRGLDDPLGHEGACDRVVIGAKRSGRVLSAQGLHAIQTDVWHREGGAAGLLERSGLIGHGEAVTRVVRSSALGGW